MEIVFKLFYLKKMSKRDSELDACRGTICTPTGMKVVDGKYYLSLILMLSSSVFPLESGVFLFVGLQPCMGVDI